MSLKCRWIDNRLDMFYVLICITATPYSLLSCLIRFSPLHTCFPFTSPRFFMIYPRCNTLSKNAQLSQQRYFRDVALTPARITDITLSRTTLCASSHFLSWNGHSLATKKVKKVEKVKKNWVHTYPTVSSRPRGLVRISSEMWICIKYKQTNKQKEKIQLYNINWLVFFYNRGGKCLQHGTDWVLI
jgi:hypothetical protein